MYARLLKPSHGRSFYLFGPRGVGKTSWISSQFPDALVFDLLDSDTYRKLLSDPSRLKESIPPGFKRWIAIDEIQRIPELLNEVHRLIEKEKYKFILTGSSARKLRRKGTNLLAGRALTYAMHPLTSRELKNDFSLKKALSFGMLPSVWVQGEARKYIQSYIKTYLREEVQEEGLARNLSSFSRFMEVATFSQGSVLNYSNVGRDAEIHRKVVEDYFTILEDLLIGIRLPVFNRRTKRKLIKHAKFYYFDVGIFRELRPKGPLDSDAELDGPSLETLVLQEIRAINDYLDLGFKIHFWKTTQDQEVDFVLYGERGLIAIEVKRSSRITGDDLKGLRLFREDYPMAKTYLVYGGTRPQRNGAIEIMPVSDFLKFDWWG